MLFKVSVYFCCHAPFPRTHQQGRTELSIGGPEYSACKGTADSFTVLPSLVSHRKCGIQIIMFIVDVVCFVFICAIWREMVLSLKTCTAKEVLRCMIQFREVYRETRDYLYGHSKKDQLFYLSVSHNYITELSSPLFQTRIVWLERS